MSTLPDTPNHFTSVIIERRYELQRGESRQPVVIKIGQPVQDVPTIDGFDWRCPVRWRFEGKTECEQACGIDAFQAVEISMTHLVDIILERLEKQTGGQMLLFGVPTSDAFGPDY